jgi:hypothetical protein
MLPEETEIIHSLDLKRSWSAPIFSHTVSAVCTTCNSGWMSQLEAAVMNFIGSAIFAHSYQMLSPITQVNAATWIVKTAMMCDQASGTDHLVIPDHQYARIATMRQPPRESRVYVAKTDFLEPEAPRIAASYHGHTAKWTFDDDGNERTGYVAGLHIGYFAGLITSVDGRDDAAPNPAADTPYGPAFVRVWPPTRVFRWPGAMPLPLRVLDDLPERV